MNYANDVEAAKALHQKYKELKAEIAKVIIGQDEVVETVLNAIFSNGHTLMIGLPGLAKTLLVRTVSEVLDLSFNRIQFTPDLMPGDITGSEILDDSGKFSFIKGPVFCNVLLADEINRTPPKTQAALLESMQEKSVTVNGKQHKLSEPFFVLATQNPIEQEGTYPLPEAQLDRFMYNVFLDYPAFSDEIEVIRATTGDVKQQLNKILSGNEISYFQHLIRRVPIADNVLEYAVKLVVKTRPGSEFANNEVNEYIAFGAGPRAGQFLVLGAKCHALLNGKYSPDIEDVKAIALPILRHRLIRNYKAEASEIKVDSIIRSLL